MNYGVCSIMDTLPNILTSKVAIIVYIGVILASIVVLMIMLIVKESDKKTGEYKIGDIVTYIQEGDKIPTTHRIVDFKDGGGFVTRGDANNAEDLHTVYEDEILGEVVLTLHTLGLVFGWLGSVQYGIWLCFGCFSAGRRCGGGNVLLDFPSCNLFCSVIFYRSVLFIVGIYLFA